MALSCGIIGLPMTGKSTFFNLLTQAGVSTSNFFSGKTSANMGTALVPDRRIDYLSQLFKPKKTTYAQLELIDVPGLTPGASTEFLNAVRDSDALVHVVRAFRNDQVLHVENSLDVMRDLENIQTELILNDLQLVETRLERINAGKKKKMENPIEEDVLLKLKPQLENEVPLSAIELSEEEQEGLRHMTFLSAKPVLLVVNVDEEQLTKGSFPKQEELAAWAEAHNAVWLPICAQTEAEISQLPEEDRALFMEELGLSQPGIVRLAQSIYELLGLISFLTAGEDEVRAWPIRKGTVARKAAGKIHSDIERGFIRAETVAFADLEATGSMAAAREKGLFRLEGKEYVVQDGDIINFRFNV